MCGIVGFLSQENVFSKRELVSITNAVSHRGPDADGYYFEPGIGLGHRRLSILDLSEAANQPFYSSDKRYVMVYNGEVYNFQEIAKEIDIPLKTTSDTEVILEAFVKWGPEFVSRLNGMFAFAIYDTVTEELYIYRDRMGIKPVYYYWDGNNFVFASELKSIKALSLPKKLTINKAAISEYLHLGYIPRPYSIYNEINKMDSGVYFKINTTGLQQYNYWQLEDKVGLEIVSDPIKAKNQLKELIISSVNYRMISDVPFGTFLSGGIDSSLITAVAQEASFRPVNTFSIAFNDTNHNEAIYAKEVAKYIGTNHHEFTVTYSEAIEQVSKLVDIYDEPFADSSAIPTLLISALARKHVTMILTGDGGDELFLGYGMYQWANRLNNPLVKTFRKPIAAVLAAMGNKYERASTLFEYGSEKEIKSHIFSQEQYLFSKNEISQLLTNNYKILLNGVDDRFILKRDLHVIEEQALYDMKLYLQDDLLVKVDRATMHHSLEAREPLLDYHIVEFALNLDVKLKSKQNISKYLLKEVLYDFVPQRFFDRPKWGFSIPLKSWLQKELRYLIEDYLSEEVVKRHNVVNYTQVKILKDNFTAGKDFLYNRLWLLIVLHNWLEKHNK
jgi:asparagine synthase (glutamine-hydrolysing)